MRIVIQVRWIGLRMAGIGGKQVETENLGIFGWGDEAAVDADKYAAVETVIGEGSPMLVYGVAGRQHRLVGIIPSVFQAFIGDDVFGVSVPIGAGLAVAGVCICII